MFLLKKRLKEKVIKISNDNVLSMKFRQLMIIINFDFKMNSLNFINNEM